jgi:hypothetical protein
MSQDSPNSIRLGRAAGEGMYLASSWTWCIGMFLPVLLLRDMGAWSWLAFAIPNVVGAAAMGAVLAAPGHSAALTTAHHAAMRWFSIVTLAFQLYFLVWILIDAPDSIRPWLLALVLVVIVLSGRHARGTRWSRAAVACTYIASAALGAFYVSAVGLPTLPPSVGPMVIDLAFLAPVCVLGFALCPYLDLSFHAVRQRTPGREGTVAFLVGFGVFFLAMILLTLVYAPSVLASATLGPAFAAGMTPSGGGAGTAATALAPLTGAGIAILAHLTIQASITAAIHRGFANSRHATHTRESNTFASEPDAPKPATPDPAATFINRFGATALAGIIASLAVAALALPSYAGLSMLEIVYRGFMAFYGLIAPAYVWTCMVPSWSAPAPPRAKHLGIMVLAILLAAPFYWIGFIEREYAFLAGGVLVVLASGLLARRR